MGRRTHAERFFDALVDIGTIVSTTIGAATSVISRLRGDAPMDDESDDDPLETEEMGDVEIWGEANLLSRPLDPTDDGACEALFVRRGDTREIVGMRDRRWQTAIEKGEALLRNVVADAAKHIYVHLTKDGAVVVKSDDIQLTGPSPGDAVALASKVNDRIDAIQSALDALANAVPTAMDGGAALQTQFKVAWPGTPTASPADVGSTKVKAS